MADEDNYQQNVIDLELPKNKWIFVSHAFDYEIQ